MFKSKHPTLKGVRLEMSVKLKNFHYSGTASDMSLIYLLNLKLAHSLSLVPLSVHKTREQG